MSSSIPTKTLPSGATMPQVGLGVYMSEPGAQTYDAVRSALQLGYRHVDTAQAYENEADVGRAVRESGIPREQIFVTSKVMMFRWSYDDTIQAFKTSLELLGLDYLDLYLLHAPFDPAGRADAWRALEDLQQQGLVRDIGVSNFSQAHLEKLSATWRVKPAVNQIELDPWCARKALVQYCESQGILLEAYSPLAKAKRMDDPAVAEIATQAGATVAQVLLAWGLSKQFIVIPKSVNPGRQKENLESAHVTLTAEQLARLDALDEEFVTEWDPITEHAV